MVAAPSVPEGPCAALLLAAAQEASHWTGEESMHAYVRVMESLIRAGADINYQDSTGRTPLSHVIHIWCIDAFFLLLAAHADPSMPNEEGMSALHHTTRYAASTVTPIVEALVEAGANVHAIDAKGNFALMYLTQSGGCEEAMNVLKYAETVLEGDDI